AGEGDPEDPPPVRLAVVEADEAGTRGAPDRREHLRRTHAESAGEGRVGPVCVVAEEAEQDDDVLGLQGHASSIFANRESGELTRVAPSAFVHEASPPRVPFRPGVKRSLSP